MSVNSHIIIQLTIQLIGGIKRQINMVSVGFIRFHFQITIVFTWK